MGLMNAFKTVFCEHFFIFFQGFRNQNGFVIFNKKFGVIVGFDYGMQQRSKGSGDYDTWYAPVVIAKYAFTDKFIIATRGEYYFDDRGVIIRTGTTNGFQTYGYSLNFDYQIHENISWRIEGRTLTSKDAIFSKNTIFTNKNYFFTTSFAISF